MPIIQPNGFDDPRNYDDVFSRSVLAGLLSVLREKIFITNITDKGPQTINIPFFPNMAGDSRFMQDFFFFGQKCIYPKLADGNYDSVPRGVITLTDKTINQSAMTHRFTRAKYVKNVDGKLQEFSAYINSIPIQSIYEVVIHTDTYLDMLKIEQTIIEVFYKTQIYSIFYKGFKVPAQCGFPENFGQERLFEYAFPDDQPTKLTFNIEVDTYQPVVDLTSVMANNKRMLYFSGIRDVDDTIVRMIDAEPVVVYAGADLPIKWETTGDVLDVNITYRIENDPTEYKIDTDRPNNGLMIWNIPVLEAMNSLASVYLLNIGYYVHREAVIRPIFDGTGALIDLIILDAGLGYSETTIIEIEEPDFKGTRAEVQLYIVNGQIAGFKILNPGLGYTPTIPVDITIQVQSARHEDIFDEWTGITIQ